MRKPVCFTLSLTGNSFTNFQIFGIYCYWNSCQRNNLNIYNFAKLSPEFNSSSSQVGLTSHHLLAWTWSVLLWLSSQDLSLCICLSVYLSVCVSGCLCIWMSVYLSVSVYQSVWLSCNIDLATTQGLRAAKLVKLSQPQLRNSTQKLGLTWKWLYTTHHHQEHDVSNISHVPDPILTKL